MDKRFIIEYWKKEDGPEEYEAIEVPTRTEAEEKQAELAEEGYGSLIREVRE